MKDVIDWINNVANAVFQWILSFLPTSPFADLTLPSQITDILGYVNYYVPISGMLVVAASWTGCILIYYAYQLILRHINAIS